MKTHVPVKPAMLRWAWERTDRDLAAFTDRFPHLEARSRGEASSTLKQLESFAKATYTPIGYLFFSEPPEERIPIPDFRTVARQKAKGPSPDLLDTIYVCQQRQEWYREFARSVGEKALTFVGAARVADDVVTTARAICDALAVDLSVREKMHTWTDALLHFIEQADAAGIMVMCGGGVLNNNRRHLDPDEFRGFAIADPVAPVIFINGADTKPAHMFTLAHELAHVWLGQSAVSDAEAARLPNHEVERWCHQVAAELLVPLVARRRSIPHGSGAKFYLTAAARVSKRFARAIVVSTWEGRSSFTEAFRLLGVKRMETFRGLSESLGMFSIAAEAAA